MSNHGENTLKRQLKKNESDKGEGGESGSKTPPLKEVIPTSGAKQHQDINPTSQFLKKMKTEHPSFGFGGSSSQGDRLQSTIEEVPNKWSKDDQKIVDVLGEWNGLGADADDVKGKEVYSHLPEDVRKPYEDKLKDYETLEQDYGGGLKKASDLKNVTEEFNTMNKNMREVVEFEQKVYDLTEMTSERFSNIDLGPYGDVGAADAVKERIARTAERIGWKAVMERATEVIQRVNNPDSCDCIIETIGESGDTSLAKGFVGLLANEQLDQSIRWEAGMAIGNLGGQSEARDLVEMLPNEQFDRSLHDRVATSLYMLKSKRVIDTSITDRLEEIRNNTQTSQRAQQTITEMLRDWREGN